MATVTITGLSYDATANLLSAPVDFSALGTTDVFGMPMPTVIVLEPEAIGNRIAMSGFADGDAALTGIVLEHAARVAPDATGVTVDWQSPSDEEKAAQLDALADRIEAAKVFYGDQP